jgi:hypothetical protein
MTPDLNDLAKQGITALVAGVLLYEMIRDKRGFNKEVLKVLNDVVKALKAKRHK